MSSDPGRLLAEWELVVSTIEGARATIEPQGTQVPVTVVAGFLGAGKTTLVRNILVEDHGLRIVAVINDIGALDIDAELIAGTTGETVRLTNGCACCAMGGDLARAVEELRAADEPPDAIVVEASGLADPVAMAAVVGEALDGVITVVDAATFRARMAEPLAAALLQRQLDAAHLVVLNKVDLVTGADHLVETLGLLAPGRTVLRCTNAALPASVALGAATMGARPAPQDDPHDLSGFVSRTVRLDDPVDRSWLVEHLETLEPDVLRVKGFARLRDDPDNRTLVQAVGRHWSLTTAGRWRAVDEPALVEIGYRPRPDPPIRNR